MRRPSALAALAASSFLAAGVLPAHAATLASAGAPAGWTIQGRARNGNTGFEAVLFTPANPESGGGVPLNPAGAPVWQFGTAYDFQFDYTFADGGSTWSIDFNQDGDFNDPQESATSVTAALAGQSFGYAGIYLQGSATSTATLNSLVINGTSFGPYGPVGDTPLTQQFVDSSGLFGNITATGSFTFSASGGSDERPRLWFRVGQPQVVPVPAAVWLFGSALGVLGIARRRFAA